MCLTDPPPVEMCLMDPHPLEMCLMDSPPLEMCLTDSLPVAVIVFILLQIVIALQIVIFFRHLPKIKLLLLTITLCLLHLQSWIVCKSRRNLCFCSISITSDTSHSSGSLVVTPVYQQCPQNHLALVTPVYQQCPQHHLALLL